MYLNVVFWDSQARPAKKHRVALIFLSGALLVGEWLHVRKKHRFWGCGPKEEDQADPPNI
jgi:hypothetical protein